MAEKIKEEANDIYKQLVQNPLNEDLTEQYTRKTEQIHNLMRQIAVENDQRMKFNWLVKRDKPTDFFYNKVNAVNPKRKGNFIINEDGSWISTSEKLAREAIQYFSEFFSSSEALHQFPVVTCKRILSKKC